MQLLIKNIDDLKPYENNPRNNFNAIEPVANSIKEFGFKVPIVIDKDNVIVAGHTRFLAAHRLNMTEVPCIVADDLTDEQIKAYRLADNKVSERSTWDEDLLLEELDGILDINMTDFGFILDDDEKTDSKPNIELEENFELIIECDSEEDMNEKFDLLKEMGIECRISTL